ncbi:hypothetical protein CNEO2_480023 [Clostridium neonatale]|nr:hypothetical protein CNEO2_350024 [Clostridium neonatale]CAI3211248.1 hypothetical protein CNEO2_480023 [Clostridium neonatale]
MVIVQLYILKILYSFLSGIFLGMLIMIFLSGRVVFKVHSVKNLGKNKIKLIRFVKDNGEQT